MRLFSLLAVLLLSAGAYLLVAGVLRLKGCVEVGLFSWELWRAEFWLVALAHPGQGLGPNAHWLLRVLAGAASMALGTLILRVVNRR